MPDFKVGQEVTVNLPQLGGKVSGVILMNDLRGPAPLLIRLDIADNHQTCIQTSLDGSGVVEAAAAKPETFVSYLFADGTATKFATTEVASKVRGERTAIGAMKANRRDDGSYYNHEFVSFADTAEDTPAPAEKDQAPPPLAVTRRKANDPIPPELQDFFDKLFGRKA